MSDPCVILNVGNSQKPVRTRPKDNTLSPVWGETFDFTSSQGQDFVLQCSVIDTGFTEKPLGDCTVKGQDICQSQQDVPQSLWYNLTGDKAQGRLQLTIKWSVGTVVSATDTKETPKPLQDLAEKQAEEERQAEDEVRKIKLKVGDYQVLVHVIEATDLCPKDKQRTCDPVVVVRVCDQKQQTRIMSPCTSCFFDHHMAFELPSMGQVELRTATIKFTVNDSDWLVDDPIGSCEMELLHCYFQPNHEMWESSICLVDEQDPSRGPQGFLRVSVTVLGPEDTQMDHVPAMGREELEVKRGVYFPPSVQLQMWFLVVGLHRAEDLPAMDNILFGLKKQVDAFIEVKVNGCRTVTSSIVVVSGTTLNPIFDEELWIPILLPSRDTKLMSDKITITAWDYDHLTRNDRIGTTYLSLWSDVQAQTSKNGKRWYNMYGPPNMVGDQEVADRMTLYPSFATQYRGRVLLSLDLQQGCKENEVRKVRPVVQSRDFGGEPKQTKYIIRACLLGAALLPDFDDLFVRVCIGHVSIEFPVLHHAKGTVSTMQCKQFATQSMNSIALPVDMEQVPDVFIYLSRRSSSVQRFLKNVTGQQVSTTLDVSYARIPAKELLTHNFKGPVAWYNLAGNRATAELDVDSGDMPGAVLMRLGLGTEEEAAQSPPWPPDPLGAYKAYELRLHFYRAHNLPLGDKATSRDPYLKVFGWNMVPVVPGWSKRSETCHPQWYETLRIGQVEFPVNVPLPDIAVQVWDSAAYYLMSDTYVGCARVPLSQAAIRKENDTPEAPEGQWYPIRAEGIEDECGQMLVSAELCALPMTATSIPKSIKPLTKKYTIEIFALGLRGLQSHCAPSGSPYCQFEVGDSGHVATSDVKKTKSSCRPTPCAPNFLDRILLEGEFPADALSERNIHVRVMDAQFGGLVASLLGIATIPLKTNRKSVQNITLVANPNEEVTLEGGGVLSTASSSKLTGVARTSTQRPLSDNNADVVFKWMEGRETLHTGLEDLLASTCPFESFPILRGASTGRMALFHKTGTTEKKTRVEGWFKGCVTVLGEGETSSLNPTQFLKSSELVARVYVLRGLGLRCDADYNVDPYLVLHLGDWTTKDRAHHCDLHQNANFHRAFEVPARLPGASRLTIEVWNRGYVVDKFIGATTIDIEDRWYNAAWKQMAGYDEKWNTNKNAAKPKPMATERRPLWASTVKSEQGKLELWVDIVTAAEAKVQKPLDIALPPSDQFEVRVVVWKTIDLSSQQEDCFVKCKLGESKSQATDTHWQCRRGNGSFNYRMVFPVELAWHELDMETPKTKLHFQVFDAQVIVFKACLAERTVDLRKYFLLARRHYKKGVLDLFSDQTKKDGHGFVDTGDPPNVPVFQKNLRIPGICVSIQICSKEFSEAFPVGLGQAEPNNFPFLPPPAGRHGWQNFLNPCFFLDELDCCGTTRQRSLCCIPTVLLVIILVFVSMWAQMEAVFHHFGTVVVIFTLVLILTITAWTAWHCRKASPRQREANEVDFKNKVSKALQGPPDPKSSGWLAFDMVDVDHNSGWAMPQVVQVGEATGQKTAFAMKEKPIQQSTAINVRAPEDHVVVVDDAACGICGVGQDSSGITSEYEFHQSSWNLIPGVAYRLRKSKSPDSLDEQKRPLKVGDRIFGVDEGDGWLRVGNRYLPTHIDGKRLLFERSPAALLPPETALLSASSARRSSANPRTSKSTE